LITGCYNTGSMAVAAPTMDSGPIAGNNTATVTDCYWLDTLGFSGGLPVGDMTGSGALGNMPGFSSTDWFANAEGDFDEDHFATYFPQLVVFAGSSDPKIQTDSIVSVSILTNKINVSISQTGTYEYVQGDRLSALVPLEKSPTGIPGIFTWKDGNYAVKTTDTSAKMVFTPNDFRYKTVTFDIAIIVVEGYDVPVITPTGTYEYIEGEIISARATTEVAPSGYPGNFTWVNGNHIVAITDTTADIVFTPRDARYKTVTFSVPITAVSNIPAVTQTGTYTYVQGEKVSDKVPAETSPAGVSGTFAWKNGNEVLTTLGPDTKVMVFTPVDPRYLQTDLTVNITVTGGSPIPTITQTGTYEYVQGESLSARVPTEVAPAGIPGTFSWKNGNYIVSTTDTSAVMVFTSTDFRYLPYDLNVTISVEAGWNIPPIVSTTTYHYAQGEPLSARVPTEAAPAGIPGIFAWKDGNYIVSTTDTSAAMVFTPADFRYLPHEFSVTISVVGGLPVPPITQTGTYEYIKGEKLHANIPTEIAPAGIPGTFAWQNGNDIVKMGDTSKPMVFIPNDARYSQITFNVTIRVVGLSVPSITQTGVYSYVQGEKVSANIPSESSPAGVPGTFSWYNGNETVTTADTTKKMVFTPNDPRYSSVTLNVTITVTGGLPVPSITQTGTYRYVEGERLSVINPSERSPTGIPGTFAWESGGDILKIDDKSKKMVFTPNDFRYSPITFDVTVTVDDAPKDDTMMTLLIGCLISAVIGAVIAVAVVVLARKH